ncbi:MAG: hypothetical protein SAJ12_17310 [Jaaginema sp. PMC 1079.18]|nr:hypothetical protein [Jaaginema sp. PMC 1080.18]MEC4852742.1 hypothetical protein [Jaaginema sp. PMC 1079.18]MEC4867934.1 hypothetical protein [Jaaginema sp. PMC 1078.18]
MSNSSSAAAPNFNSDRQVWASLKEAIAMSSGFGRWRLEQQLSEPTSARDLDVLVRRYLRETLETLAY